MDRQEGLVKNIQEAHADFCKAATGVGGEREAVLMKLAGAYDTFNELRSNLTEGTKFYNDLTQLLVNFQGKINDFCFARRTEKEELMRDLTQGLANMKVGTTPSTPVHHQEAAAKTAPPRPPPPTVPNPYQGAPQAAAPPAQQPGAPTAGAPLGQAPQAPQAPQMYGSPQPGALPYPVNPTGMPAPQGYVYQSYPVYTPMPQGYYPYFQPQQQQPAQPGYPPYPQQPYPNYPYPPQPHPPQQ